MSTFQVNGIEWTIHSPRATLEHLGLIPSFVCADDPRGAQEQLTERYGFGWYPITGFTLQPENSLSYPGDPDLFCIASAKLREETICFYLHSIIAVVQPDRSFAATRMD